MRASRAGHDGQPANPCLLEPDLDSTREKHDRVLRAVKAVSAVVSDPVDVDEVLVLAYPRRAKAIASAKVIAEGDA